MSGLVIVLLLCAGSGLWRLGHASTTADRLAGIQMLASASIAVLIVLAHWSKIDAWRDVALILAILAAVITVALVRLLRRPVHQEQNNV
ncbi:monovalent cation/H+ antiporter complex subunit F [Pseudohongiella spirulinae]|nr:MrpF/PhaF family protein [Pseudohongiella spirulinae]